MNTSVQTKERKQTGKIPTQERLIMGDVANNDNRYFSLTPTLLEYWRERGLMGSGPDKERRYAAGSFFMEMSERTNLMASNTTDYRVLKGASLNPECDNAPIDMVRFLLKRVCSGSRSILVLLAITPSVRDLKISQEQVCLALDELGLAIEELEKSDLFSNEGQI